MQNTMWALVKDRPEAGLTMKRVPVPAAHTKEDLEFAVKCFIEARRQVGEKL